MPTYPVTFATGRSRTLTLTKALSCPFNWGIDNQLLAAGANGGGSFQAHLDPANPTAVWTAEAHIAPPKFNPGDSAYYCVASTQVPGQAANTVEVGVGTNPTATVITSSGSLSATLTLVCPVVEYCTIYRLQDVYATATPPPFIVNDGRGFPDYSGNFPGLCPGGYPDGLEAIGIGFYEVCKSGSSVVVTSSNGPAVSSETWVCSADFQVDYVITDISGASANCLGNPAGYDVIGSCSTTLTATTDWNGAQFGGSGTYTNTESYGSVTTSDIGGHSISVSASLMGYHDTSVVSHISEGWAPPLLYKTNLKTQYFGAPAPLVVDAEVAPAVAVQNIGSGTTITQLRQGGTIDQHFHSDPPSSDFDFPYNIPVLAQWTPVRFWLDEPALTASKDGFLDWRCQVHGKPFNSFTLTPVATESVLAAQSVTSSTGAITPLVIDWEGFRYLQFTADIGVSLQITTAQGLTKTWSFKSGSVSLDLCSPTSWNQDSSTLPNLDDRKSRYPLASGATYPDETGQTSSTDGHGNVTDAKGAYWGVFEIATFEFTGLTSTQTLHVGTMTLARVSTTSLTYLPGFQDEVLYQIGSASKYVPFAKVYTDGKLVADFTGLVHVPGTSYTDFCLTDLLNFYSAIPGWTATAAGSFPDSVWHDNTLGFALWAMGSGAYYQSLAWTVAVDMAPVSGSFTVVAQPLYDEVLGYPGIGDAWNGAAYPTGLMDKSLPLPVSKFIRSRCEGITLNKDGTAASGATVSIYDPSGSDLVTSTGISTIYGYQTIAPFIPDSDSVDVCAGATALDAKFTFNTTPRESRRLSFRTESSNAPRLAESDDGRLHLLTFSPASLGSDIRYQVSNSTQPPYSTYCAITQHGGWTFAKFCVKQDLSSKIIAIRNENNAFVAYLFESSDDGQTFTQTSINMQNPQQADIRCSPDGTLIAMFYIPDSGISGPGTFQAMVRHAGDSTFGATFQLTDGSQPLKTDGTGFGFDAAKEGAGRWALTFVPVGQTAVSVWMSSDDAATWKQTS